MSKLYLYHISFFESLLRGLKSNGVPLNKLMNKCSIKKFNLHNPDTYIPYKVGYDFLNKVKHTQGIDNIAGEFYCKFQLEHLSNYGQFLSNCPDLHSILRNAINYSYLIQSHGQLYLRTDSALSWFGMIHTDAPSTGRQISEQINLAMILKTYQLVLGQDWTPLEIKITTSNGYWLKNLLPNFNFKLHTNCPEIGVRFKTNELAAINSYYSENCQIEDIDLGSVECATLKIFDSINDHYLPTVEEFAEYFGYSSRTVIRGFAKNGTSYREIVNKYQYMKALELIEDYSLSIESIGSLLGYSNTSNFIKAFKKWTSTTPNRYRHQTAYL